MGEGATSSGSKACGRHTIPSGLRPRLSQAPPESDGAYRTGNRIVKRMGIHVNQHVRADLRLETNRPDVVSSLQSFGRLGNRQATVFPVCRVPACCWNAVRSRATHWNVERVLDRRADYRAPRLAALWRTLSFVPAALLSPGVRCSMAPSLAVRRSRDSLHWSDDRCGSRFCLRETRCQDDPPCGQQRGGSHFPRAPLQHCDGNRPVDR